MTHSNLLMIIVLRDLRQQTLRLVPVVHCEVDQPRSYAIILFPALLHLYRAVNSHGIDNNPHCRKKMFLYHFEPLRLVVLPLFLSIQARNFNMSRIKCLCQTVLTICVWCLALFFVVSAYCLTNVKIKITLIAL